MPQQNTPSAADAATVPEHVRLTLRAVELERRLTEEDYATNSPALQACMRAWDATREASS